MVDHGREYEKDGLTLTYAKILHELHADFLTPINESSANKDITAPEREGSAPHYSVVYPQSSVDVQSIDTDLFLIPTTDEVEKKCRIQELAGVAIRLITDWCETNHI